MPHYSITYSPVYLAATDVIRTYFVNDPHTENYNIAEETGSSGEHPHLQIWLQSSEKCVSNVRKRFVKFLDGTHEKSEDWRVALVINSIKDTDIMFVLGYTLKENGKFFTDLPDDVLTTAKETYEGRKLALESRPKGKVYTARQVGMLWLAYCRGERLRSFSECRFAKWLQDNEESIPYDVYKKLNKKSLEEYSNYMLAKI